MVRHLVDASRCMLMGQAGVELAAAGNTEVVHAKFKTMKPLNLNVVIEDITRTSTSCAR
jgi:hypothetical protein